MRERRCRQEVYRHNADPLPPALIFLYLFMGYIRQGKRYLFLLTKVDATLTQISHNPLQRLPLST